MTNLNGSAGAATTVAVPDIDVKALVRASRRPQKTVPICLRGDLVAEFEALDARLAELTSAPKDDRLNNPAHAEAHRVAEQMRVLQDEMRAATIPFRLRALHPTRWAALQAEHPPRKGEDGKVVTSDMIGVNAETFWVPLIRESVIWPKLDDDDWAVLLGEPDPTNPPDEGEEPAASGLSDGQLDSLGAAAWRLNRSDVDVPFSRAASRILQSFVSE